jgi:hypothetical protein
VREVDDVEQPEDDGQAQAQHGVEGAIHQAQHELAQEGLDGDAEDFGHGALVEGPAPAGPVPLSRVGHFHSGHLDSALVVQASSPLKTCLTS